MLGEDPARRARLHGNRPSNGVTGAEGTETAQPVVDQQQVDSGCREVLRKMGTEGVQKAMGRCSAQGAFHHHTSFHRTITAFWGDVETRNVAHKQRRRHKTSDSECH
ncbi:hypothetical protein GCM10010272_22710 [Streptomyces lateritius]|nr:hypothetical protein GCM10010272_22710 [Streptomyces lateritius]